MKKTFINEIGNRYGKLIVIDFAKERPFDKKRNALWLCKCDCGRVKEIIGYNLRGGHSKSCGCLTYKTKSNHRMWNGYEEISGTFFNSMKNGAKNRDLIFDISMEYIWNLFLNQDRKCAMTGLELILPQKCKDTSHTASLDRIDSSKGYVEGNVQWIHKDLNVMKMDLTEETFFNYCKLVYEYKIKQKCI